MIFGNRRTTADHFQERQKLVAIQKVIVLVPQILAFRLFERGHRKLVLLEYCTHSILHGTDLMCDNNYNLYSYGELLTDQRS